MIEEQALERTFDLARSGDRGAFGSLVREYQSLVYSIAFHFLRNSALAEEIAQEIFLEMFRNLDAIQSKDHLLHWLRRTTLNRCIDQSRKHSYKNEVPFSPIFDPVSHDGPDDPMSRESLKRFVAVLPQTQRAIVILRYQEDLEPGEIAAMLGVPVNTVKSRLSRALKFLRLKLERKQAVQA